MLLASPCIRQLLPRKPLGVARVSQACAQRICSAASVTPDCASRPAGRGCGEKRISRYQMADPTAPVPFLIGVAGGTASGKTSVCRKIMAQLNKDVPEEQGVINLSQDSFYRNLTPQETADIANFNFDHPNAFAFDEIIHCLRELKQGRPVQIPDYDFVTSSRKGLVSVQHADVILFDGILAFYNPALQELFDLKIFVDTDADTRLARRVRRDIMHRGRELLQVLDQYERTVKPSFESYIMPTKKYADIIIPRGAENQIAIDLILQHIKFRLSSRSDTAVA